MVVQRTAPLDDWLMDDLYLPELLPVTREVESVMPFSMLALQSQRNQP